MRQKLEELRRETEAALGPAAPDGSQSRDNNLANSVASPTPAANNGNATPNPNVGPQEFPIGPTSSSGGGIGGGAIDPVTALAAIGLAGAGRLRGGEIARHRIPCQTEGGDHDSQNHRRKAGFSSRWIRTRLIQLLFAAFLVGVPFWIPYPPRGSYVAAGRKLGTLWIFPVSSTLPFVFLALVFLAHCERRTRSRSSATHANSLRPAYLGASLAWAAMIAFTIWIAFQNPGPRGSSTLGIAVALTPFMYVPFLVFPYFLGALSPV